MAAATSKMECFVIIVNGFQPDAAAALDPPLFLTIKNLLSYTTLS